jgi:hypothetical protein
LGSEHPKRAVVVLGVLKQGPNTAEVDPLANFAHDTNYVADARGTDRDER